MNHTLEDNHYVPGIYKPYIPYHMKKRQLVEIHLIIISVLFLLLTTSCKKDNDDTTVTDIEGNVYNTVTIGSQVWMKENLKTIKYRNGDIIGTTIPATFDYSGEIMPKYQWAYGGNEGNATIYGRLYTWYALSDSRGICPSGWHVPGINEWITLIDYAGGLSTAGGKLKETGTIHWLTSNTETSDVYGFTALPGGYRDPMNSIFSGLTGFGVFWSSTELNSSYGSSIYFSHNATDVVFDDFKKGHGFSIRCVKD